ncbi:MAG: hypothetical protein JWM11_3026 [Planctomycetaceae bacterium]|nr:hypothetical protein [Planctomycetaceae bacterium]
MTTTVINQRIADRNQRIEFDAKAKVLRDKWGISEPELHKMPIWLRPLINDAIRRKLLPKPYHPLDAWFALQHATKASGGDLWVDHVGRIKLPNGVQQLISEPYGITDEGQTQLSRFCELLGLRFEIQDESWWFPNNTIRVTISRLQDIQS